mmetsp:Transcript_10794/g.18100  ORF Transcript_10794/g.18100 Transcript_10794/m.18100 type:complete len:118 (+) Transcript_10794:180-533(+)
MVQQSFDQAFCIQKSREQQHSFNIPFQLSHLPGTQHLKILKEQKKVQEFKKLQRVLLNRDLMCQDDPSLADEYNLELQEDDVIVTGTDGLFDNLFTHEIISIVHQYKQRQPGQKLYT